MTMITPSYLGETIEYSSLHACRSTLEDPTRKQPRNTHLPGVAQVMARGITYLHLLFDDHEIIRADGAWSESYQPGPRTLAGMEAAARAELEDLFPGIAAAPQFPPARPTLKAYEARVLLAS